MHFEAAVGVHLADERGDLRRADVEADDQVRSERLAIESWFSIHLLAIAGGAARGGLRLFRQPIEKPFE